MYTHTCAHIHTHAHTHTHARTRTRTHARTCTHIHTSHSLFDGPLQLKYAILTDFLPFSSSRAAASDFSLSAMHKSHKLSCLHTLYIYLTEGDTGRKVVEQEEVTEAVWSEHMRMQVASRLTSPVSCHASYYHQFR